MVLAGADAFLEIGAGIANVTLGWDSKEAKGFTEAQQIIAPVGFMVNAPGALDMGLGTATFAGTTVVDATEGTIAGTYGIDFNKATVFGYKVFGSEVSRTDVPLSDNPKENLERMTAAQLDIPGWNGDINDLSSRLLGNDYVDVGALEETEIPDTEPSQPQQAGQAPFGPAVVEGHYSGTVTCFDDPDETEPWQGILVADDTHVALASDEGYFLLLGPERQPIRYDPMTGAGWSPLGFEDLDLYTTIDFAKSGGKVSFLVRYGDADEYMVIELEATKDG